MYCGDRSKHCGISAVALHFCLLILSHVAVSNKYNTYRKGCSAANCFEAYNFLSGCHM